MPPFHFTQFIIVYKEIIFPMVGFEPRISGVRGDSVTIWAKATSQLQYTFWQMYGRCCSASNREHCWQYIFY